MGYRRSKSEREHLARTYRETKNRMTGVYEYNGRYRKSKHGNRAKFCRRQSNRAVRRSKIILLAPADYRRLYDYWWELL